MELTISFFIILAATFIGTALPALGLLIYCNHQRSKYSQDYLKRKGKLYSYEESHE
ncbi:hypothetical protein H0A36_30415 [Endozoicomonas sp. SM1973]|uniref:Uncharacterized protein n=1 Tax=Spartinivicinus marinus TaxID=2994442 RepID=A0A853IIK0_9GAMM|nr:hypothetical protein [Spartinivicinus marinus]MCX4026966.1 hypothetical protein [Spartinivicinus marinus]NYZ70328.1 hypothetical protein [Spartinivicinus marinus]